MSSIEEVKQKTDIVEIIGQYVTLKKSGRNFSAPCPFHNEQHPSFFVYPEQQSWHCFGACNTGGDVISFIMKKENMEFGDALRLLADRAGIVLPTYTQDAGEKDEKDRYFQINDAAALYFHNNLLNAAAAEKAREYVKKRGYSGQTVTDFQLGYSIDAWEALKNYLKEKGYEEKELVTAGLLYQNEDGRTTDRFRGKLIIPIRDRKGRVTGFGARVLDNSLPKYVNSPQTPTFDKSGTLFAIDKASSEIRKQDCAIIMEGYMDVITAHQNGVTNAVASMGTAITEKQVLDLRRLSKNLILVLDADSAGKNAMILGGRVATSPANSNKVYQVKPSSGTLYIGDKDVLLEENPRVLNIELEKLDVKVVILPEGKDPDDIIKTDIKVWNNLLAKAIPVYDYLFETMTSDLDMNTAKGKANAVERLSPIISGMYDNIRQAHYIQKLSRMVNLDVNLIKSSLNSKQVKTIAKRRLPLSGTAAAPPSSRPLVPTSREEYLLLLLLNYPNLRDHEEQPEPDYFISSESREIYHTIRNCEDITQIKNYLDPVLFDHFERITGKGLPDTRSDVEKRYLDCLTHLKTQYLKTLAARKAAAGGQANDPAVPEENINISNQLRELDTIRNRKRSSSRR